MPDTDSRLVLRSRLGAITLVLLCAVQFLDIVDSAIVNVALPSIQHSLGFSQQNLQWVASGYILTYGGFLLLGGRLGDLLGRRRMLLAGLAVFAASSLTAGLASSAGLLVGRPARPGHRRRAHGPGGAVGADDQLPRGQGPQHGARGLGSGQRDGRGGRGLPRRSDLAGTRLAMGLLRQPADLRPVAAGALALLARDRGGRTSGAAFDSQGAVLVTGGMLLLVYGLVRAPIVGWGSVQTIVTLAGSGVLLIAFAVNELRSRYPLVPFAILRVKGLVAADLTQLIAFTGFFSMFFYATLYMQEILHYSPLKAGAAYLPITAGFAVAGGLASQLVTRIGTRPVVVAGCLIAGAGIYYVSRVPLHGSYVSDLLPGFVVMSLGAGSVFVSVTAAANAGVPSDKAGLAAGLLNSSQQIGSALGLAILSAVAITRTNHLIAAHVSHRGGRGRRLPPGPARRRHLDGGRSPARPSHRQHPAGSPTGHGQRGTGPHAPGGRGRRDGRPPGRAAPVS